LLILAIKVSASVTKSKFDNLSRQRLFALEE